MQNLKKIGRIIMATISVVIVLALVLIFLEKDYRQKFVPDLNEGVMSVIPPPEGLVAANKKLKDENVALRKLTQLQNEELNNCGYIRSVEYK